MTSSRRLKAFNLSRSGFVFLICDVGADIPFLQPGARHDRAFAGSLQLLDVEPPWPWRNRLRVQNTGKRVHDLEHALFHYNIASHLPIHATAKIANGPELCHSRRSLESDGKTPRVYGMPQNVCKMLPSD